MSLDVDGRRRGVGISRATPQLRRYGFEQRSSPIWCSQWSAMIMLPRSHGPTTRRGRWYDTLLVGHGLDINRKSDLKVGSIWTADCWVRSTTSSSPMTARRRSEFQKSELRTPIEFRAACGHHLKFRLERLIRSICRTNVALVHLFLHNGTVETKTYVGHLRYLVLSPPPSE